MFQVVSFQQIVEACNDEYIFSSTLPPVDIINNEIKNNNVYIIYNKNGTLIFFDKIDWYDCYTFIKNNNFIINNDFNKPVMITCYGKNNDIYDDIDHNLYKFIKNNKFSFFAKWIYYIKLNLKINNYKLEKDYFKFEFADIMDAKNIRNIINENLKRLVRTVPSMEEIISHINNKEIFIIRNDKNKEIAGVKIVKYQGKSAADHGIAVLPKYRGENLSKLLIYSFFNVAIERNIVRTDAWIDPENKASTQLHVQCGYEPVNRSIFKFIIHGGKNE